MKKRTAKPKGSGRVRVERTQPSSETTSFPAVEPGTVRLLHAFVSDGQRIVFETVFDPPLVIWRPLVAPEHRALSWGALAPGVKP